MKILASLPNLPITETAKGALDHVAAGLGGSALLAWLLAIASWLPTVAAAMSIAWYAYRFWESYQAKRQHKKDPTADV